MGPSLSTFRLRFALMAAAVLSALSAAEATLAAAPMFDVASKADWPAQLTPVKDRDSGNPRTARAADHSPSDHKAAQHHGGDGAADLPPTYAAFHFGRAALPATSPQQPIAGHWLVLTLLDLPPPVL